EACNRQPLCIIQQQLRHVSRKIIMIPRHSMRHRTLAIPAMAAWLAMPLVHLLAQAPAPKPQAQPDVLILDDDEKLVGHFVRSNGGDVRFKSAVLGEVTIPWSKVKELHAAGPYTVVGKDVKLGRSSDTSKLPKGSLDATAKQITVSGAPGAAPATVAVA